MRISTTQKDGEEEASLMEVALSPRILVVTLSDKTAETS